MKNQASESASFRKIPAEAPVVEPRSGQRKICWKCGSSFTCGAENAPMRCWCADLPPVSTIAMNSDCLCGRCLSLTGLSTTHSSKD